MKKKIEIIVIVTLFVTLAVVGIYFVSKKINNNDNNYVIIYGYTDQQNKIISNYSEYLEFVENIDKEKIKKFKSSKYNKEYFKNKSLAVFRFYYHPKCKFIDVDISIKDNTIICKPKIENASSERTVTAVITGSTVLIEIDKSVTNLEE